MISDFVIAALIVVAPLSVFFMFKRHQRRDENRRSHEMRLQQELNRTIALNNRARELKEAISRNNRAHELNRATRPHQEGRLSRGPGGDT